MEFISDKFPHLVDEYDTDKNYNSIDSYSISSHKKVWWKCKKGHEWETRIGHRTRGSKCPYCTGRKPFEENRFNLKCPHLIKEWHPKNIRQPSEFNFRSSTKVWWKCEYGHEWETTINNRSMGSKCDKCNREKINIPYEKSLQYLEPELAKEWNEERNKRSAKKISSTWSKKVWWKCENNHEWEAKIADRKRGRGKCWECISLAFLRPDLLSEWNYKRNTISPNKITALNNKKVWWKCENNHEWETAINNRTKKGTGCPKCHSASKKGNPTSVTKENSFVLNYPQLLDEWDYERNLHNPEKYPSGSNLKVWWKCQTCKYSWEASVNSRVLRKSGCIECYKQHYNKDKPKGDIINNNLKQKFGDLIQREWNYDKNKRQPEEYSCGSNIKVWWKCENNHEWETAINNRTNGKNGCPYCSCRRFTPERSLETRFPHIAEQWHPTKNGDLTPEQVWGSTKKIMVWWKCPEADDHEWKCIIDVRTKKKGNCPFCDGKRVCKSNCLQTTHPKLCDEWHPIKNGNLTPEKVTRGCSKKVWWKCKKKGHEWQSIVHNRSRGSGCPYCIKYRGEEAIVKILKTLCVSYTRQKSYDTCRYSPRHKLKFDFHVELEDNEFLIEFNGIQHYEPVKYFGGKDNFEIQKKKDRVKSEWCTNNNMTLLIIPYTQFNEMEKIITEFISGLNNSSSEDDESDFIIIESDDEEDFIIEEESDNEF